MSAENSDLKAQKEHPTNPNKITNYLTKQSEAKANSDDEFILTSPIESPTESDTTNNFLAYSDVRLSALTQKYPNKSCEEIAIMIAIEWSQLIASRNTTTADDTLANDLANLNLECKINDGSSNRNNKKDEDDDESKLVEIPKESSQPIKINKKVGQKNKTKKKKINKASDNKAITNMDMVSFNNFQNAWTKDPNAPKKPLASFFVYLKQNRATIKEQNPGKSSREIPKLAGENWKKLSNEEKKPYETEAKRLVEQYKQNVIAYEKSDGYIKRKKEIRAVYESLIKQQNAKK